jgi:rSAM/selenodomain-associated transferase 1
MKLKESEKLEKNALCIFAKYPELGKVKTRLAKDIGDEKALKVYKSILTDLVKDHKDNGYDLYIAFTPIEKEKDFKKLFENPDFFPQKGKNLGKKMHNAFRFLLNNHKKVIIIGSDMPDLTSKAVKNSFKLVDRKDIILGPSFDGGYYLIGMKKSYNIFSNIEWSTSLVLTKTLELIKNKNLSFSLLEKKHDIDTIQELELYQSGDY